MKSVLFQNQQIAYEVEGSGPALIFIHGFPMDRRVWQNFIPAFIRDFTTISIDLPGFGQSEQLADEHPMWLMSKIVEMVLEAEQIEKVLLVGHSMGGYVALELARQKPGRISGLILFHSHGMPDNDAARAARTTAIAAVDRDHTAFVDQFIEGLFYVDFVHSNPDRVERIKTIALSQSALAIKAAIAGLRDRESQIALLSDIKVPVLFILGKNDNRMPFASILAQVALPSHAELLLLGNVGHMGFEEAAETTSQAIWHFAKRIHQDD